MDQQRSFIQDVLSGEYTFSSLCEFYGVSRQGGYTIVKRFEVEGENCFESRSKRPLSSPHETSAAIVARILFWRTRKDKNRWGARKIRAKLIKEFSLSILPSNTTIHNILCRHGLVDPPKRRRLVEPQGPIFDPSVCNEIWSIDHKGKYYLGNGKRCSPLTVCDSKSRMILLAKGQYHERWRDVRKELIKLFERYGQPKYLHSDNGSAFASIQSPLGYGSLAYWCLDHGVRMIFSDPGCPAQNGRHERMHRDLKAECCCPASYDLRVQNRKLNQFAFEHNHIRPHEALQMETPASVHEFSPVKYSKQVADPVYGSEMMTRKVAANGALRWGSYEWVSICNALSGKYIGVKPLPNRAFEIYYRDLCLGYFVEGEGISKGRYYKLTSNRDLPERYRDRKQRRRK